MGRIQGHPNPIAGLIARGTAPQGRHPSGSHGRIASQVTDRDRPFFPIVSMSRAVQLDSWLPPSNGYRID